MGFKTIIKNADQQKNYMREIYSKFWSKSRKKYGLEQYSEEK